MLRRIFGPRRKEVRGDWRKLHNEEYLIYDLYKHYWNYQIKDEMGRTRRMYVGEKCIQNSSWKT
jgi:hypothetical protein